MNIRINRYITKTKVEGFGNRFVIWTQGCSIRCQGCANKEMWDKKGGRKYKTDEIIELISLNKNSIEGITFLGGEPLEQIKAVTEISKKVQNMGLSVIVFTGYELKKLESNPDFKGLKNYIDLLIDGKFTKEKLDFSRPWVGSSNQRYYFLSDRYNEDMLKKYKNKIEIRITKDKKILLNGMGDYKKIINNLSKTFPDLNIQSE